MPEEKLLTVREAASILGISEKEIVELAESGKLPAYKVGGVFLRFKKEQISEFKKINKKFFKKTDTGQKYYFKDRVSDFFYFNDFYILALLIIILLLIIIFRGF
jgi:excisionase family DNA binding protein